jgi:hypothetical protein
MSRVPSTRAKALSSLRRPRPPAERWQCPASQQAIIVSVGADPEPSDDPALQHAKSTIAEPDAYGVDVLQLLQLLKSKAGMAGIGAEETLRSACLVLNLLR